MTNKQFIKTYKENIELINSLKPVMIKYKLGLKGEYTKEDLELMNKLKEQLEEFNKIFSMLILEQ